MTSALTGPTLSRLRAGAVGILGRDLTGAELAAFDAYVGLLLTWQRRYRLVGSTDVDWIVDGLLLDSLIFARFLPSPSASVLDLGSGAGIPGIPLKITTPRLRVTLLEARRRRASFLAAAVRALGLREVSVIGSRAESALLERPELKKHFQIVVSRAAGDLDMIVGVGKQFVEAGGSVVVAGPPQAGSGAPRGWVFIEHPLTGVRRAFFVAPVA